MRQVYKTLTVLLAFFVGCLALFSPGPALAQEETYEIKVATLAPEGTDWIDVANMIKRYMEEKSSGRVKVLIYAGGVMGDDPDVIRKMRLGQVQLAGFSGHGTHLCAPEMALMELPYIVDTEAKVDALYKQMNQEFKGFFAKHGFRLLYLVREGYNQLYTQIPIRTLEDMKKIKPHMWTGKVEELTFNALGSRPQAIGAVESVPAMRAGIINAHFSPALWELGTQLFTIDKYINFPTMRYHPASLVVAEKAWQRYPKWVQDLGVEACEKYGPILYQKAKEGEVKSIKAFEEYGMKLVKLSPEEERPFREATRPLWDKLAGDAYPKDALDKALAILKTVK
ncbi:MAG: TRAP transporter substrate-binding protein DctP [Nitrospirota bacterium]|nr:TRAP transporter substrate-binding protein DctP [Nitrospirota bacterium]